ncbi:hypothetical protein DFJ73DRAFT_968343 [Zopfochytrium polystomum]|nr:hypothetical protein DFJ73DRAFT_968343 [Zopfochytrium polystomum]
MASTDCALLAAVFPTIVPAAGSCCTLNGVTCDATMGVTRVNFAGKGLTGPLSTDVGKLLNLTYLSVRNNSLTGTIPAEIGNLVNLQELYLAENRFSGTIPPQFGQLTKAFQLNIRYNRLTGAIPPEIGLMTNLQYFDASQNELSGSLPPELGQLTSLRELWLNDNQISGWLPPEIGNMTSLTLLKLQNNFLRGTLPPDLSRLANVQEISLNGNRMNGVIPPQLVNCFKMTLFDVTGNFFTGDIPNLPQLTTYNLFGNCLPAGQVQKFPIDCQFFTNSHFETSVAQDPSANATIVSPTARNNSSPLAGMSPATASSTLSTPAIIAVAIGSAALAAIVTGLLIVAAARRRAAANTDRKSPDGPGAATTLLGRASTSAPAGSSFAAAGGLPPGTVGAYNPYATRSPSIPSTISSSTSSSTPFSPLPNRALSVTPTSRTADTYRGGYQPSASPYQSGPVQIGSLSREHAQHAARVQGFQQKQMQMYQDQGGGGGSEGTLFAGRSPSAPPRKGSLASDGSMDTKSILKKYLTHDPSVIAASASYAASSTPLPDRTGDDEHSRYTDTWFIREHGAVVKWTRQVVFDWAVARRLPNKVVAVFSTHGFDGPTLVALRMETASAATNTTDSLRTAFGVTDFDARRTILGAVSALAGAEAAATADGTAGANVAAVTVAMAPSPVGSLVQQQQQQGAGGALPPPLYRA